jgi:hypothetical protein
MRDRFHFREIKGEWWVWDVRRLAAAARDLPTEMISLGQIAELDENCWFVREDEAPTVRAIAEHAAIIAAADLSLPILLYPDGRVLDGMHRVCRAWIDGVSQLPSRRFRFLPLPDYRGAEAEAFLAERHAP